jgi:alginate O-acetyltransferase complex protein AlgI
MVFSSLIFLFVFLPLVLGVYYMAGARYHNLILLLFSLLFYMWGEPTFVFVMMLSILVNYLTGRMMDAYKEKRALTTVMMIIGVGLNLSLLGYYKYTNFFAENINGLGLGQLPMREIILPVGISFFTFQGLSYILDVYFKKTAVQRNILNLALYISFFPQLIAGPIVRYETFEHQISNRHSSMKQFVSGMERFIIGLSKKVLIANALGYAASQVFSKQTIHISTMESWIGIICFTLQIYYDFSGYSDMAIGLGRLFGFEFLENFNYPYISQSITEFWRRWHISLGTWFRDYVYIPLGGNRVTALRGLINLGMVWILTGLWHGASWHFVVWGVFYGLLIILERAYLAKRMIKWPKCLRHLYVMILVMAGWVLFNSPDLIYAGDYLLVMMGLTGNLINQNGFKLAFEYKTEIIAGMLLSGPIVTNWLNQFKAKTTFHLPSALAYHSLLAMMLFLSTTYLVVDHFNPFIYFRF